MPPHRTPATADETARHPSWQPHHEPVTPTASIVLEHSPRRRTAVRSTVPTRTPSTAPSLANVSDIEGDIEWVDRSPPRFDPKIAAAWAEFALHYPAIASELFDDDPELTTLDTPHSIDPR